MTIDPVSPLLAAHPWRTLVSSILRASSEIKDVALLAALIRIGVDGTGSVTVPGLLRTFNESHIGGAIVLLNHKFSGRFASGAMS